MYNKELGILCHISSLYSEYGVGTLGKPAKDFVDFLAKDGYTQWEVLPLNKIDGMNCPYASTATMAQEELYIDLEKFVEQGVLSREEVDTLKTTSVPDHVDYEKVKAIKYDLLNKAYYRQGESSQNEGLKYMQENPYIKDYALYRVLSEKFGTNDWATWPKEYRFRDANAIDKFVQENSKEMAKHAYLQKTFEEQFKEVQDYAHSKNIKIVGDCAIYADSKSVDVWANQDIFKLDENSRPYVNGGTPGQNWGTCMYRWDDRKDQVYNWWFNRIKHDMNMYDILRLDHYTGFCWHYEIPSKNNANDGYWAPAGGFDFFNKLFNQVDKNRIIIEDIGTVSQEAYDVRNTYGIKGMGVAQWAFDGNPNNGFLPHNIPKNTVYYIGTHDNTTLRGFLNWADDRTIQNIHNYFWLDHRVSKDELAMRMLKSMFHSNADTVMLQLQDVLLQDENYMMNHAGVAAGQWAYMAPKDYATKAVHPADLQHMFYKKLNKNIKKVDDKTQEKEDENAMIM